MNEQKEMNMAPTEATEEVREEVEIHYKELSPIRMV